MQHFKGRGPKFLPFIQMQLIALGGRGFCNGTGHIAFENFKIKRKRKWPIFFRFSIAFEGGREGVNIKCNQLHLKKQ